MLIRMGMGGQLSGSVGGVTASRNRYGAYLRNRTVPVNPNTPRQLQSRAAFAGASLAWAGLTDAQRATWQSYATQTPVLNRLGESITLSANAWFVAVNAFAIQTIGVLLNVAPLTPGVASLGTAKAFTFAAGALEFSTTGGEGISGLVSYSPSVSPGVESFSGPFSKFGISALGPTGGGVITQTDFRYGTPVIGQRRYFRIRAIGTDGKLSDVFSQFVDIAS